MAQIAQVIDQHDNEMTLSMGPQHPATHGVLKLVIDLDGETVKKVTPHVGYLHRGTEKLGENRTYLSALPLTDRLDYISSMCNNIGYCVAVEKLLGIKAPERAQYLRTALAELNRISSHLLWLATHALDIGAMTVFLYAFREREQVMEMFEMISGARLTVSFPRIGGLRNDVSQAFIDKAYDFVIALPERILEYETLIDQNRIWLERTKGIGILTKEEAIHMGCSGPMIRGSGVAYDIRKMEPYDAYDRVEFEVPVEMEGDVYARYRVRMRELRQSALIVKQCLEKLPTGAIMTPDAPKFTLPSKEKVMKDMEALIHQFVLVTKGPMTASKGEVYVATEAPKGELGYYFISDGTGKPYRMRLRSPSFVHASTLPKLCEGHLVADIIANIGTLDIVLGECDR